MTGRRNTFAHVKSFFTLHDLHEASQRKDLGHHGASYERRDKTEAWKQSVDEGYVTDVTKYMIGLFYKGSCFKKAEYYTKNMVCIAPKLRGRKVCCILHRVSRLCLNQPDTAFAAGSYQLVCMVENGRKTMTLCHYSAMLQEFDGTVKLTMLHISEEPGMMFRLTDVVERTHFLAEAEILYLESGHNRVFWHTWKEAVEVAGTLLHAESGLPDAFVRIHKSFIVNSLHVEKIDRCYAELTNGERLQIPVKKYTDVRKELIVKREWARQL